MPHLLQLTGVRGGRERNELWDALDEAGGEGAAREYVVSVMLDGNNFSINRVELDTDGTFRIYLEE